MDGKPFGTITFKAEPTEDGEAWLLTDAISFAGGEFVRTYTSRLDRQPPTRQRQGHRQGAGYGGLRGRLDAHGDRIRGEALRDQGR